MEDIDRYNRVISLSVRSSGVSQTYRDLEDIGRNPQTTEQTRLHVSNIMQIMQNRYQEIRDMLRERDDYNLNRASSSTARNMQ